MKLVGRRHCWATQRSFGLWHLGRSPWCIGAGWPPAPAPAQTTTTHHHQHHQHTSTSTRTISTRTNSCTSTSSTSSTTSISTTSTTSTSSTSTSTSSTSNTRSTSSTSTPAPPPGIRVPPPLFCGSWLLQKRSSEFVGWLRYMPWLDEFSLCPLVSLRSFDAFSTRCLALIIFQCFKCVLSCLCTCLPYWFTCEGSLLFTILRKGPFWPCWLAAWFCHGVRGEDGGISAKLRKEGYRLCRHLADGEKIGEKPHVALCLKSECREGMLRDSHWVHPEVFFFFFWGPIPRYMLHHPASTRFALWGLRQLCHALWSSLPFRQQLCLWQSSGVWVCSCAG